MKRIQRYIINILYKTVAIKMPKSNYKFSFGAKKIRFFCAKRMISKCGNNVNVEKGAKFGSELEIGDNSGIGVNCEINGKVIIGKNVMMGPEVVVYTQNHEFSNKNILICQQGYREKEQVVIGDDVWIGRRVIILPGVNIGNGAVVGAGAVVAKDVPDFAIAVGNPVKIVGYRE